jgi:hypothetical protein
MALRGEYLDGVDAVMFAAHSRGRRIDAHPKRHSPHRLLVRVPERARSGLVQAVSSRRALASKALWVKLGRPASTQDSTSTGAATATEGAFPSAARTTSGRRSTASAAAGTIRAWDAVN